VMTLSYSRYMYVEFVFRQDSATWLELPPHAFEWFGGVPKRVVLDNLKAASIKPAGTVPSPGQYQLPGVCRTLWLPDGPLSPESPNTRAKLKTICNIKR